MPALGWLDLSANRLTGNIPPELGSASSLLSLRLDGNALTGGIPPELGNLARLFRLLLNNNQLTGSIPPELGRLGRLEELLLNDNRLSGAIPRELGGLAELRELDLARNDLGGAVRAGTGGAAEPPRAAAIEQRGAGGDAAGRFCRTCWRWSSSSPTAPACARPTRPDSSPGWHLCRARGCRTAWRAGRI